MFNNYSEETYNNMELEILTGKESKPRIDKSEEETASNNYYKLSKRCVNQHRKSRRLYPMNNKMDELRDCLSHEAYSPKYVMVQNVDSFTQTDNTENTVAVQADINQKAYWANPQKSQFVQTDENYPPDDDCTHSGKNWDSNKSEYSESSNFFDAELKPFTKVIPLSSIPNTMKLQQDYMGHLEEKTYRVSRWLDEHQEKSNLDSQHDFIARTPRANDLIKKVSFCNTISPTVAPTPYFHHNAVMQTECVQGKYSMVPAKGGDEIKHSENYMPEWERKNIHNSFGSNEGFVNGMDRNNYHNRFESNEGFSNSMDRNNFQNRLEQNEGFTNGMDGNNFHSRFEQNEGFYYGMDRNNFHPRFEQNEVFYNDMDQNNFHNRHEQNEGFSKGIDRSNFHNRYGQHDGFHNGIDYEMIAKAEEVKRELLSRRAKILRSTKTFIDEDSKPNCYKTMHETPDSPEKEHGQVLKIEPVKVRKRFSNYLKDQYRNLSDDTMGKSYMMMQDLREVLQKRGVSK